MRYLTIFLLALIYFAPEPSFAADNCSTSAVNPDQAQVAAGDIISYSGVCDADNERIITTGDLSGFKACWLLSTVGSVDVYVSLNGTIYATSPLSMIDMNSTSFARVVASTQGSPLAFELGGVRTIRVLAVTSAATVTLNCFR